MKKKEKMLFKELQSIQKDEPANEKRMNDLIKKAINFFQDELHPKLADVFKQHSQPISKFYFEYGNILVSILEQQDEEQNNNNNNNSIDPNNSLPPFAQVDVNKEKDKELRDAQVAFENLETARSIVRNHITTLNIELQKLQEQVKCTQQQISELHDFLSRTLKRIGDLQQWQEEWQDSLQHYEQSLDIMKKHHADPKIVAEIYYKIGNVLLLENSPGCEKRALSNFQQSFQICYEQSHQQKLQLEQLTNAKSIQKLKQTINTNDESTNMLLVMLLEKIEDTIVQERESSECKNEIEKWKDNRILFEDPNPASQGQVSHSFDKIPHPRVLNLGTLSCNQAEQKVGNIIIKRIKKDT